MPCWTTRMLKYCRRLSFSPLIAGECVNPAATFEQQRWRTQIGRVGWFRDVAAIAVEGDGHADGRFGRHPWSSSFLLHVLDCYH
jgi:hypothetical protein